jgi:hypothetical protein
LNTECAGVVELRALKPQNAWERGHETRDYAFSKRVEQTTRVVWLCVAWQPSRAGLPRQTIRIRRRIRALRSMVWVLPTAAFIFESQFIKVKISVV